mmetsp:Transcript_947/g.2054  ORF Transcript_947/g.2054 Transcript_947/m.2054 type:complete len:285 (-) Transcript_947:521-1375(-)
MRGQWRCVRSTFEFDLTLHWDDVCLCLVPLDEERHNLHHGVANDDRDRHANEDPVVVNIGLLLRGSGKKRRQDVLVHLESLLSQNDPVDLIHGTTPLVGNKSVILVPHEVLSHYELPSLFLRELPDVISGHKKVQESSIYTRGQEQRKAVFYHALLWRSVEVFYHDLGAIKPAISNCEPAERVRHSYLLVLGVERGSKGLECDRNRPGEEPHQHKTGEHPEKSNGPSCSGDGRFVPVSNRGDRHKGPPARIINAVKVRGWKLLRIIPVLCPPHEVANKHRGKKG